MELCCQACKWGSLLPLTRDPFTSHGQDHGGDKKEHLGIPKPRPQAEDSSSIVPNTQSPPGTGAAFGRVWVVPDPWSSERATRIITLCIIAQTLLLMDPNPLLLK